MTETGGLLVALFQGVAKNGDPAFNLSVMKEQMKKSSTEGAQLIIFPELFLTGYAVSREEVKRLAEEKDGPSFQELSAAAKDTRIAVVYGYSELDSSSGRWIYNSAQLIDQDGKSLLNYRKIHPWLGDEQQFEAVFTPGNEFSVVECCGVKVGLLICYDVEFPESVRALAVKGAQLIAVPTAISTGFGNYINITQHMIPTRAMENRVYVAYVNHTKGVFAGHSVCCHPNGHVVVKAVNEESLLLAPIDPNYKPQYPYLVNRRPTLYKDLITCN